MATKTYHHGDLKNALIKAGVEILSKEGIDGLSLRKVAQHAGVSHNAPYSHFPDKQSLIAAISTEGFKRLYEQLDNVVASYSSDPKKQLHEAALAYVRFAMDHVDTFKIMFSDAIEKEKEYPAFVEISQKTFQRVVDIVQACQDVGIVRSAPADIMAVAVWGQVHGIVSLVLDGQISHAILDHQTVEELVSFAVRQTLS